MNPRDLNERLLDRLVDGELAGDERRQLLAELEAQPGGWRRCALAFIEAQTWRTEMQRIVKSSSAGGVGQAVVALGSVTPAPKAPAPARSETSSWKSPAWLAAAAALLIAFGLGRQLGVGERSQLQQVQVADATSAPIGDRPTEALHGDMSDVGDAITLVVNDHRGVPQRVRVPLVEARELGGEFSEVPHWTSPELMRRLDQQGLGIAAKRRYAPLMFEQQNQMIPFVVPVDDAVVTPVSRPLY